MSDDRTALIDERLHAALNIETLDIVDESHLHAGHAGARAGGGHYRVRVVSPDFQGVSRLQRHRLIYDAIGEAMRADTIHALSITALTPAEVDDADRDRANTSKETT